MEEPSVVTGRMDFTLVQPLIILLDGQGKANPVGQLALVIHHSIKAREAKFLCPIRCLEQWAVDHVIAFFVEDAETWEHFGREA